LTDSGQRPPGRVWALDFTEVLYAVDGCYVYLLAARDLASGQQLLAWPNVSPDQTTEQTALRAVFVAHGAGARRNLLRAADRHSAFEATSTTRLSSSAPERAPSI
jgi:hypothetical protein